MTNARFASAHFDNAGTLFISANRRLENLVILRSQRSSFRSEVAGCEYLLRLLFSD